MLAIGAHPDDIEYGCGGTLLRLGPRVKKAAFVATLGSNGDPTTGPGRAAETRAALQELGVTRLHFREQPGLGPDGFEAVLAELSTFIRSSEPELILTLGPHDTHQEHRRIYELTLAAARRWRTSILAYAVLSNTPSFTPTVFVDVADVLAQKKRILALHRSQSDKYYMGEEYLEIFHSNPYAALHGMRYCEAYEVSRLML